MSENESQEEALFEAALKLTDPNQRSAFLAAVCAQDTPLRQRLEMHLAAQSMADILFDQGAAEPRSESSAATSNAHNTFKSPGAANVASPATDEGARRPGNEGPGAVLGRYQLLEKIGEGGGGVVYMAEQAEPVRRRVALKVVKWGMDTKEVIARFEAERQALALMDHPNIAKVFDAGATETGRPYFVMELVRGVPITQFCDEQQLPMRARLDLFITVCQAVHHAHQKGIIHRDIKPSNVLVAVQGGLAAPKVIDFGIAKATEQKLTDKTLFTRFHQVLGTPAYMSPEQVELAGLDIDTRSDIYSLGVLLYELLAGCTPFEGRELLAAGFDEMRRRLREEEPKRPSTRVSMLGGDELTTVARGRQVAPRQLELALRGELDWIVMKALEKDRRRRYESASALGQDVERYLRNEPVSAAAPSTLYTLRKFARRNRLTLAALAAVAASLAGGAVVSTWLAVRAMRAENETLTEAAISKAVNDFLQNDLLGQASPESQPDRDLKLRTVLDRAAQRIEGRFASQPLVEASIRNTIVLAYRSLGEARAAEPHAARALELYRSRFGSEHPGTLNSMNNLAVVYSDQGKLAEAATLHAQALEIQKRVLGPENSGVLISMNNLAELYRLQGKPAEAETLHTQVLEIRRRTLPAEHSDTLATMNNLASVYGGQGKRAEAAALLAQVLEIQKRAIGHDHPDTVTSMNNLAVIHGAQGKFFEAANLHAQLLEIRRRVLGPDHPDTLISMNNLAVMHGAQGKFAEAAALHAQTLESRKRALGLEHPQTLGSMNNLACIFESQGKLIEARQLLQEALQHVHDQTSPTVQSLVLASLGHVLLAQQRFIEAEPLLRECLELSQKLAPDEWRTFHARSLLGGALSGQKRFEAAEPLLLEGYEGLKQREQRVPANYHVYIREAAGRLVRLYESWDKPARAAEWKARLRNPEAVEIE
jgi:serine/threonine protein kinase